MKTIEEKAKAYDEALERAKQIRKGNPSSGTAIVVCEQIFPELAESEDERSRKWILEYLYDGLRKADEQFKDHFKSAIDWLEKQKEPYDPEDRMNHPLYLEGFDVGRKVGQVEAEQKPAWSEEDEEILDSVIRIITHFDDLAHEPTFAGPKWTHPYSKEIRFLNKLRNRLLKND